MTIFEKAVSGTEECNNMPTGSIAIIQCDVDFDIQFWNPVANAYDPVTTVTAPGGLLGIPHNKALITGTANVRIVNSN